MPVSISLPCPSSPCPSFNVKTDRNEPASDDSSVLHTLFHPDRAPGRRLESHWVHSASAGFSASPAGSSDHSQTPLPASFPRHLNFPCLRTLGLPEPILSLCVHEKETPPWGQCRVWPAESGPEISGPLPGPSVQPANCTTEPGSLLPASLGGRPGSKSPASPGRKLSLMLPLS